MKTRPDPSTKPYYRCLSCVRFGHSCSGHSTRDMDLRNWCEYMRDVKEVRHLTNAYIANAADVSVKTIERIMAISIDQDIMRETARRIEIAVIGTANQYPCYLVFEESAPDNTQRLGETLRALDHVLSENEEYRTALDNIHTSYNAELRTLREEASRDKQAIKEEAQKKIDYLLTQVERLRTDIDYQRKIIDKFLDK